MLTLHTDRRLIENWPVKIPTTFDWATENLVAGEWVRVNGDNELTRVTVDLAVPDAFPLQSQTGRSDIDAVDVIGILRGFNFTAMTDQWKTTNNSIVAGSPLKVTGNGKTTDEGGILELATSGDLIRAVALKVDGTNLTFRFLEGWATV